jgi:hypothetical protein
MQGENANWATRKHLSNCSKKVIRIGLHLPIDIQQIILFVDLFVDQGQRTKALLTYNYSDKTVFTKII